VPSAGDVRAVVDTNVLLSGLFWRGRPHALMEQIRAGALTLISSPALLAELAEVLNRPKFQVILARSETDPEQTLGELRRLAEILEPLPLPAPVSRDPADDAVLTLATASQADLIITGDADLLTLGNRAGIPIIDPVKPSPASAARLVGTPQHHGIECPTVTGAGSNSFKERIVPRYQGQGARTTLRAPSF
jgi:putative PIN family toxin of toxin-antitoxin system